MFEPSALKILKYLRSHNLYKTDAEIAQATAEAPEFVEKALAKLTQARVVTEENGKYQYDRNPESETFFGKLLEVCSLVDRGTQMELLVRGLVCSPPQPCLMRLSALMDILRLEGFSEEEVALFLKEETKRGYIKRIQLVFFMGRAHPMPTYVPQEYIGPLSWVDMETYHHVGNYATDGDTESPSAHEDYLLGRYSQELASQAKEYLDTEKAYIKEKLREEAMRHWFFWLG